MKSERGNVTKINVLIIGGGAAGLMCAIEAGKRGRKVLLLERNERIGEKIRISGGGRCNFTNLYSTDENFISKNPHFCKSALARYTPHDFIRLVEKHGIKHHEKKLGQLFCDDSSRHIIGMLERECDDAGVEILTRCTVHEVDRLSLFTVKTDRGTFQSESLVIATGGLSIPKLGATSFGYGIAKQFGLKIVDVKPGLVPLLFQPHDANIFAELSGVSVDAIVRCGRTCFRENILFTHRGLSGPAILQVSSYWNPSDSLSIDLMPEVDVGALFRSEKNNNVQLSKVLRDVLPNRFVQKWCEVYADTKSLANLSLKELDATEELLHGWEITPSGTEGFEKAEVTVGGVDTDELSSKTMEAKKIPGLFFVGEVVDVTGHLGGHNFQWAWASGFAAGQFV